MCIVKDQSLLIVAYTAVEQFLFLMGELVTGFSRTQDGSKNLRCCERIILSQSAWKFAEHQN